MREDVFPKAVLFDWDNTLVDTWPVITEALGVTRAAYGLEVWTLEQARVRSARSLRESFPEWFGDKWEEARDLYYKHFAAHHCERLATKAGAEDLLRFLQERGVSLFVVSNKTGKYLREEIDYLDWGDFFQKIVGANEASRDKPAPACVEKALEGSGLSPDSDAVWLVGDTVLDMECAIRSSCVPVLLHDLDLARRLGLRHFFSDCARMQSALYNWSNAKSAR